MNPQTHDEYSRLLHFLLYRKPDILCEYVLYHKGIQANCNCRPKVEARDGALYSAWRLLRTFLKVF